MAFFITHTNIFSFLKFSTQTIENSLLPISLILIKIINKKNYKNTVNYFSLQY